MKQHVSRTLHGCPLLTAKLIGTLHTFQKLAVVTDYHDNLMFHVESKPFILAAVPFCGTCSLT